jgi:hypothetical protein
MIEVLAVVAVLKDFPDQGIVRGQVGTVVEKLAPAVWEVEFSDTDGQTYAMVEADTADLMVLQFHPMLKAA